MAGLELVQHQQVGSGGAATITFSSLGSYTHLLLKGHTRSERTNAVDGSDIRFNSDSTSGNYWQTHMTAYGPSSIATSDWDETRFNYGMDAIATRDQTDAFSTCEFWILDYRATDKYKGVIGGSAGTGTAGDTHDYQQTIMHGHWKSTAAITTITIANGVGDFAEHSVFSLYGLNSA